ATPAPLRARAPRPRRRAGPAERAPREARPRRPRATGCRRRRPSAPVDLEGQEVRRARDARVVVADRLLAPEAELVVGEGPRASDDASEVVLDRLLVLRGRGNDLRVEDRAVGVELVTVVEEPAGSLGHAVPHPRARLNLDRRRVRLLVLVYDPQRLVGR